MILTITIKNKILDLFYVVSKNVLFLVVYLVLSKNLHATDEENSESLRLHFDQDSIMQVKDGPDVYEKTLAVWNNFQVPPERINSDLIKIFDEKQTLISAKSILALMDHKNQLSRFISWDKSRLYVFKDRDVKIYKDFEIKWASKSNIRSQNRSLQNIKNALVKNNKKVLLKGVKIALDAGHMGGKVWEERTGKFIQDLNGNYISEAVITLQTCIVLKEMLEKLGATVLLTRQDHAPVSKTPFEALNVSSYGINELKRQSYQLWFLDLINSDLSNEELYSAFSESKDFKNLFTESNRKKYFILGEDLAARAEMIKQFNPDISLAIHYDVNVSNMINPPNGIHNGDYSKVKAYVYGSIDDLSLATAEERRYSLIHFLDSSSWNSSLLLAKEVVHGLKDGLGLDYDPNDLGVSHEISPGVFSRNLYLTRKLTGHAHAYIECLHYNDPTEFKALLSKDHELIINGEKTYYSNRLLQVANSIRDGLISFVMKSKRL